MSVSTLKPGRRIGLTVQIAGLWPFYFLSPVRMVRISRLTLITAGILVRLAGIVLWQRG